MTLQSIPESQENAGRLLVACGLWLHAGFIGATGLAAGLQRLFDGGPNALWPLALAISGGVLAAASWRRGRIILETAARASAAATDATGGSTFRATSEQGPRARRAPAANGLGDFATTDAAASVRPTSPRSHQAARARRSLILGELIVAAIQAGGASARRAHARYRQNRRAKAAYDALRRLDDRALRDLGFDRSELTSVAAEVTGAAEYTRVRVLPASNGLW